MSQQVWIARGFAALVAALTLGAAPARQVNTPPRAEILAPSDGASYAPGRPLTLTGAAHDAEDSELKIAFQWDVDAIAPDQKQRRVYSMRGKSVHFTPAKDAKLSYDIRLIVIDSGSLRDTTFVHLASPDGTPTSEVAQSEAPAAAPAASKGAAVAAASSANPTGYTLGPGDVLHVQFYAGGEKQEDFTGEVSPAGNLTSPLIGDLPVGGATATEVGDRMRKILARDYFVNPQVMVEIKEFARKVFVSGEVRNPGGYSVQEGLTVMSACTLAGGFTDYAALNRVRVLRTENGKTRAIDVDLSKVRRGKAPDPPVVAGDRIDVPHRRY